MSDTIIWLGVWTLLLWGIGTLRLNLMVRRKMKILFFPGLAVEAAIRSFACLVTGTPIEKFRPLNDGTPFLKTGKCPVQRIGVPIVMAIRMTLTFLVALILIQIAIPGFTESKFGLPTFLYHPDGIHESSWGFLSDLIGLYEHLSLEKVMSWVALYTLFTLALATGLSTAELFAAIWGWAGIFCLSWVFTWLGVKFSFLSRGWFIERWYLPDCWSCFSLLVTMSALAFLFVATLHALPVLPKARSRSGKEGAVAPEGS